MLDNQVRLDELIRKVGSVAERNAQMAEKAFSSVIELENTTAGLAKEVEALAQQVMGIKPGVKDIIKARLDEAVNQLVASHQDVVGWLRRVAEKMGGSGQAERDLGDKDKAIRIDQEKLPSAIEKKIPALLCQVISMIVAGDTSKAVEVLMAVYNRLSSALGSEETSHRKKSAGEGSGKRTTGLRTSWQDGKPEPVRNGKLEAQLGTELMDERETQEVIAANEES